MKALVNFRTMANGSYKYMRGLRRGYVRVLLVKDENGSRSAASNNVVQILWEGSAGIDGVGPRSRYWLGGDERRAKEIADAWNAETALQAHELMRAEGEGMRA